MFVSILNIIRTCSKIYEDINFLKKLCYIQLPQDPNYPYLFYSNKYVQEHNKKMLLISQTNAYILIKQDKLIDETKHKTYENSTMHLPTTIVLKTSH